MIGRRRLDVHIHALEQLGATVTIDRAFEFQADRLRGKHVFLDEASVMGTENAVMAAVLAEGETVIGNAACEPHVQDLCRFLVSLGAQIEGIESNVLRIHGVDRLGGGEYRIAPEHIEVASFIGLAAVTGGDLWIDETAPEDLVPILPHLARLGVRVEIDGTSVHVPPGQDLQVQDDLGDQIPKIEDGPWPAFPADLTSIALAVATQAKGTILIFEKMFENRLFFVDKLVGMGGADHPLRSAPRRRDRPGEALRRADGQPRHPCGHGDADREPLRGRHVDDRQRRADRPRLRADRRASARARRAHRARRRLTPTRAAIASSR